MENNINGLRISLLITAMFWVFLIIVAITSDEPEPQPEPQTSSTRKPIAYDTENSRPIYPEDTVYMERYDGKWMLKSTADSLFKIRDKFEKAAIKKSAKFYKKDKK